MPEVTVRKRIKRRSGGTRYRLKRWRHNNSTQIAVGVASLVAAVVALGLWWLLSNGMGSPDLGVETPTVTQ